MKLYDIVKPRPDRNDPDKTHWDPIGVLFVDGEKMWGQIFAIGDINVFARKKRQDSEEAGPFG
ncbi:MAG: hypothetical protein LLF76_02860 [Planctomycetaceae bacterium]|nr:hypothetical protein [Planctomycetaceae bacterium]